jgi:uncharacterized membrane protein (UPF0127 family)
MHHMRHAIFLVLFSVAFGSQIQIGDQILKVEIVDTHESRANGLMGRTELPEGEGMLFVYEKPQRLVFWMKNTLIPLSIAFFDEDKSLMNILDMDPPVGNTLIRYRSTAPALYALEVPQGWFEKHKIDVGTKFSFLDPRNQVE